MKYITIPSAVEIVDHGDTGQVCGRIDFRTWAMRLANHPIWKRSAVAASAARVIFAVLANVKAGDDVTFTDEEHAFFLEAAEHPRYSTIDPITRMEIVHEGYQGWLPIVAWQCSPVFVDAIRGEGTRGDPPKQVAKKLSRALAKAGAVYQKNGAERTS